MIAVGEVVQIFMDVLTVFFINTVETNAVETFLAGGRTYQLNIVQLAYLFLSTKISAAPQGFPRIKKVKKHTHFYLLSRK